MKIKGIISEDFINYKKPSMVIELPYCTFKCDKECGQPVCQNSNLINFPTYDIAINKIVLHYLNNNLTEAVVLGGLEPLDSKEELFHLIDFFRKYTDDDIIIYTGYIEEEIQLQVDILKWKYKNIIIKFGRFIPNQEHHYDEVLGVTLTSPNQYAKKIC